MPVSPLKETIYPLENPMLPDEDNRYRFLIEGKAKVIRGRGGFLLACLVMARKEEPRRLESRVVITRKVLCEKFWPDTYVGMLPFRPDRKHNAIIDQAFFSMRKHLPDRAVLTTMDPLDATLGWRLNDDLRITYSLNDPHRIAVRQQSLGIRPREPSPPNMVVRYNRRDIELRGMTGVLLAVLLARPNEFHSVNRILTLIGGERRPHRVYVMVQKLQDQMNPRKDGDRRDKRFDVLFNGPWGAGWKIHPKAKVDVLRNHVKL